MTRKEIKQITEMLKYWTPDEWFAGFDVNRRRVLRIENEKGKEVLRLDLRRLVQEEKEQP